MPQRIGRWIIAIMVAASVLLTGSEARTEPKRRPWQDKLDGIIASLSGNIDTFELLQTRLSDLSRSNENYSEQKNIWLSSTLTLAAIASVCEYQRDLMILFADLREKNRKHYYDVRIKSLQLSTEQISVMREQMQINHSLISHRSDELALIPIENTVIRSSIDLLQQAIEEIQSIREFHKGESR